MRERVELHGGSLVARPAPGGGFEVRATLPRVEATGGPRDEGTGMTIRVFLVDDQQLVRAGFTMLVESQSDMTVVGEAGDGEEALARLEPGRQTSY